MPSQYFSPRHFGTDAKDALMKSDEVQKLRQQFLWL